ncbi:hypothetical protein KEM60_00096 [Austwickia sp. TVS 96-490-7B]|uniref:flagellar type III secretion system pore protein FliP n=1 Tax=Austwickia sp. TVS 96-490-7B TaxID=2830843 RepID=UPI001D7C0DFF|nr:flagellar type III secretion system pore protein FliP [Austwickia sp. TVS 96-490-7B]MBW3083914.1 hypothetical protein [Austwickia sp. TVS 96-490-7B]
MNKPWIRRPRRIRGRLLLAGLLSVGFAVSVGPAMGMLHQDPTPRTATHTVPVGDNDLPVSSSSAGSSLAQVRPVAYAVPASAGYAQAVALPAAEVRRHPADPGIPTPTVRAPRSPGSGGVNVDIDGGTAGRTQVVQVIILMTVLSVAPALLLMCTSFTKIAVVLSLTRNALGTPTIPPNQVLAGLALFLSLFVMSPVLTQMNDQGVQPYLNNKIELNTAVDRGGEPLRLFMANHTGDTELQTMIKMSKSPQPKNKKDTDFKTLIPAFILTELKSAFIIGFVVFIPFLIIDLVVSSVLMSMGMMMLPPVMISLPFKLLLFVMVDGWSLITTALVTSYR